MMVTLQTLLRRNKLCQPTRMLFLSFKQGDRFHYFGNNLVFRSVRNVLSNSLLELTV